MLSSDSEDEGVMSDADEEDGGVVSDDEDDDEEEEEEERMENRASEVRTVGGTAGPNLRISLLISGTF